MTAYKQIGLNNWFEVSLLVLVPVPFSGKESAPSLSLRFTTAWGGSVGPVPL